MTRASQITAVLILLATSGRAAVVEPIAGGNVGDGLPATQVPAVAWGVAAAPNGDIYFSDLLNSRVRRVDAIQSA